MDLWYRIVKMFISRYVDRFYPEIPEAIWQAFHRFDIDVNLVRFRNQVFTVQQVDYVFEEYPLSPHQKMYLKNRLLEIKLMVYGFVLGQDNEITRVDKSLVQLAEVQKRVWNKGRLPKRPEQEEPDKRSWEFPYSKESETGADRIKNLVETGQLGNAVEVDGEEVILTEGTQKRPEDLDVD